MLMKRSALAFILLIVIVLSFASWLVYNQVSELQNQIDKLQSQNSDLHEQVSELQDQNNELQEHLNELHKQIDNAEKVMITEFSSPTGWRNPVGVAMDVVFNITITNTGTNDVEGLTLEIKRLNFEEDPFNITRKLDIIHAGETTELQEFIIISMDRYFSEFYSSNFVATLKLGELALHERTLQITKRQF